MKVGTILVLFAALTLSVNAAEVCVRSFNIDEDINLFENYTDLVSFTLDCSQPGFPIVVVRAEPPLRTEIQMGKSRNPKAGYSIKCTDINNEIEYLNRSIALRKSEPWTAEIQDSADLPLGQNCSIVGCFWDEYLPGDNQRRYAVQGSSCVTNINECQVHPQLCEQECTDTYTAYECGCRAGYKLENNSHNCTDEDECLAGTHQCSHQCLNTEGSYSCSCPTGYTLDTYLTTCEDVNECENGSSLCEQDCVNSNGSYTCSCWEGFELDSDQYSCKDINECDPALQLSRRCQHKCTNTNGSFFCSCQSGYTLTSDRYGCLEYGECENSKVCFQLCVNTTGVYHCQCRSGYSLSEDGHNCTANPSPKEDLRLVIYTSWIVPLSFSSLLIALSIILYCMFMRRRKNGNVLETNHDLYDFFLTLEKLDTTYQPVDLTNGIPLDTESFTSEMTSFHSASNIVKDLSSSEKTQFLLVAQNGSNSKGKGKVENPALGESDDTDICKSHEMIQQCGTSLGKSSSHDSCVGSSIAGDTSSTFNTCSIVCSPTTSDTSTRQSVDTSANSDYILTGCVSRQTQPAALGPRQGQAAAITEPRAPATECTVDTQHTADGVDSSKTDTRASCVSGTRKKGASDAKYVHATNALFTMGVNDDMSGSCEHQ